MIFPEETGFFVSVEEELAGASEETTGSATEVISSGVSEEKFETGLSDDILEDSDSSSCEEEIEEGEDDEL
ncbi:hypothetical protein I4300191C4_14340 [Solibaculum mannosilyticum]